MITLRKKEIVSEDIGKHALFPVYKSDVEKLNKIQLNKLTVFMQKKLRNVRKHNLVFALAKMIKDYLPDDHEYKELDERNIIYLIEFENGICDIITNRNGQSITIPKSISFANMSEDEHDVLLDYMFLATSVVAKIEVKDLRKNYEAYLSEYR